MAKITYPCHPGEILNHEFLKPLGVSAFGLAKMIGVPHSRIERLVKEQTSITPDTALRLSKVFGTTPEFWFNMQSHFDLASARKTVDLSSIEPLLGRSH